MTQYPNKPVPPTRKAAPPILIWAAIAVSIPIYAVVGFVVRGTQTPQAIPEVLPFAFGAVAAFLTGFVLIIAPKILANVPTYLSFCIVRWAMSEAIGVLGLVLLILGAAPVVGLAFLVWSFILLLILRPTAQGEAAFRGPGAGGGPVDTRPIEP